ncbi:MAG: glycosyltransferase family 4 protein [Thermoplasmata archaeon]|nr:MAG: glycosyltransferase family 4 protein [Thermoplasmata archaeon]
MKRVCFVMHADVFTPWPVVRAVREITQLKEHGYEVHVVSWIKDDLSLPSEEIRENIHIHRFLLKPPKASFFKRVRTYRKIIKEISNKVIELKPLAIVCHDLEILRAGVVAKKKLNVPLFFDAHENWPAMVAENSGLEAKIFASMEKKLLRHVTHSYTYGNDLTEKYRKMGHAAATLYNSKSLDAIPTIAGDESQKIRTGLGLKKDDFVIGFAGSASLENGIQQTADSLQKLPENFKFLVVGGSGRSEDLTKARKYAHKKGVLKRVIFTGRVDPGTMLKDIAAFDCGTALFHPLSPNHVARVPNKLFDYMAQSIPMIVSDFPNMRKIVVEEARCGYAVEPMDIEGITGIIKDLSTHPEKAKEMGKNGRRMFEKEYCWDMQKKKLVDSHPIWRGEL